MTPVIDLAAARERLRLREEARAWVRTLSVRSVTVQTLREFFDWRAQPGHREAYEKANRELP